jgi:hypothetical protein
MAMMRHGGPHSPAACRMPLPRPGLAEFVGGSPRDAGQLAQPLRIVAEPAARGVDQSVDRCVEFEPGAVAVAVDVAPDAAGELAEGDGGDLVDAVSVVAGDEVLGHGQGWVGDLGCDCGCHRWSSRRVVVAEQTREDKPNISQITSESGVSGENRL